MNAYELAEHAEGLAYEIPADWSSGEPKNVATDIADMLRQQADRIAELEKDLEGCEYFLDKQQSAEPAAWMHKESGQVFAGMGSPMKPNDFIPLYTTPQIKELSDEDIEYITKQWFNCRSDTKLTEQFVMPLYSVVNLCKAILKKASEK